MNVLIIEDDPMVDFIHRNYLEKLNLFDRIISSDSMKAVQSILTDYVIDLI
ncbi:two-component response regulator [Streptococcus dysgalactiae subsp. equisimilis]|nr:conserved domain protein [Streptococcus dysgalactiae subsp. equisimilis SK1250]SUN66359.1 two-component response regulator [Streptococcus dysgalactiae subsp. equisimilis]VGZ94038.1 Chemotaxis response regulator protein-glutamate methylesterase [Streptococcus pyogenes]VHA12921.1 Chemotaxis response regulator protein-glutamate methylesterase [Streptococcus pyogenes]VHF20836.1 Chemotaxis response regulator protein-glutamate methylesterase [Streptococcus pyogenes]